MRGKSQEPIAPTLSTMHQGKASPCVADSPESLVKPHYYTLQYISHSWGYSPYATVSPRRDGVGMSGQFLLGYVKDLDSLPQALV